MPTAFVNGVDLNYVRLDDGDAPGADEPAGGAGAPRDDLVMVHGLATNMAFWYFKYGVALAKRFRVLLYDLRGHGRSGMPQSGYTPAVLAADLAGLLDHLKIERAHFLAHSFGGVVTLNFACAQPQRVRSLVLADSHFSAGRKMQANAEWEFGRRFQPLLDQHDVGLDTSDPYFGPKLLTRAAEYQLSGRELPAALAETVSPLLGKAGKRSSADWLKLMRTTSAEAEMTTDDGLSIERLRHLTFPIIAMYGDNSPARLSGAELLEIWPHATFRRVRDAGHFFPTLKPQELMSACLRFWDGEFDDLPQRHRAGEPRRSYFRSDRVYAVGDAWFFTRRGEEPVGPFDSRDAASAQLAGFMSTRR